MFKVTVLRMKDVAKLIMGIVLLFCIISMLSKWAKNDRGKVSTVNFSSITSIDMTKCLEKVMPDNTNVDLDEEEDDVENKHKNILQEMLKTQISSIRGIEEEKKNALIAQENKSEVTEEKEENNEIKMAETGLQTEVITNNPIKDNSNFQYGSVKIKNQTDYTLTEEMLKPDINIENKNIVLFHTHTCESYTASKKYPYEPTGTFRTTDLNFTVAKVGTELENQLKQYNYNVIHSTKYHDYPSYNGSYTNSLATVEEILKQTPSDIIMDIHRDAIGSRSDYAPTVKIGDDEAAQIMFVIGTNGGGLWHPNWEQNLKFAIKIQEKAEEMYPGLFKSIMLTKSRYNQHMGKYASIIEVGATGNTLEQCMTSMKYLAKVMDEILK